MLELMNVALQDCKRPGHLSSYQRCANCLSFIVAHAPNMTPMDVSPSHNPTSEPSEREVDEFCAGLKRSLILRARDVAVCRQRLVAAMLEIEVHARRIQDAKMFLQCSRCGGLCSSDQIDTF